RLFLSFLSSFTEKRLRFWTFCVKSLRSLREVRVSSIGVSSFRFMSSLLLLSHWQPVNNKKDTTIAGNIFFKPIVHPPISFYAYYVSWRMIYAANLILADSPTL